MEEWEPCVLLDLHPGATGKNPRPGGRNPQKNGHDSGMTWRLPSLAGNGEILPVRGAFLETGWRSPGPGPAASRSQAEGIP